MKKFNEFCREFVDGDLKTGLTPYKLRFLLSDAINTNMSCEIYMFNTNHMLWLWVTLTDIIISKFENNEIIINNFRYVDPVRVQPIAIRR